MRVLCTRCTQADGTVKQAEDMEKERCVYVFVDACVYLRVLMRVCVRGWSSASHLASR